MSKRYLQNFALNSNSEYYDVVVVGAGVAGLFASLLLRKDLKVLVLAKEDLQDCNSQLAQGGIAVTLDGDYESHVEDTLKAGSYYNDLKIVRQMIEMSSPVYEKLLQFNAKFDLNEDGTVAKTAEGGHRKRRIIHSKDLTGEAVMLALVEEVNKRTNIQVRINTSAIDVITKDDEVVGLVVRTEGQASEAIACNGVVLATGGIGGLFRATTNVSVNRGDGMAIALRAGARLRDSEFIQYHPTAMALKEGGYFLISEAVRGEGGHLINDLGERFMEHQHEMKELAPRDVVAKAINEQKQHGRSVYVDVRHFEPNAFKTRFPNIHATCLKNGIDPESQPIPVSPVEHYYMGGISCNVDGQTTDANGTVLVKGLFASGEAACTGFHGANRLASNSLLECLTLSMRLADVINNQVNGTEAKFISFIEISNNSEPLEDETLEKLTALFMDRFSEVFTIVKSHEKVRFALDTFEDILRTLDRYSSDSMAYISLYNGVQLGIEIARGTLARDASLGAFLLEKPQA